MKRSKDNQTILPALTTMMIDALVKTLPNLPRNNQAAAVCQSVFTVYVHTHGATSPWEITKENPKNCEKRIKREPITIIDAKAEVTEVSDNETRTHQKNRTGRHMGMPTPRLPRPRSAK